MTTQSDRKVKHVEQIVKENAGMTFEDYWKEYKDIVNKDRREVYDKKSKFGKFFSSRDNPILEVRHIKDIADLFFNKGRLQMVSQLRRDNLQ